MFGRLKKKYWGEKIYSTSVDSAKASSVYVWRRDGELSLNIKSENFSYVQAGSRYDATVTFEADAIESLLGAIMSARTVIQQTSAGVS
ncbi:hypothetical protein RB623_10365 [Mesorhizobium sp. LHD-90]|uniref:hypothetical protein n=1 Tax=Mesorhizobium sp. LHD-90 TaxID=3071414 RepID=UPI0027E075D3|nr:hypothetical protein [Mesorhizobium sp. LHD-90]MDQ6434452.1 hypothetical protein [Mesorhizobium sp. LHD-90]